MKKLTRKVVQFWLEAADAEKLERLAAERGETVQQFVEAALWPYLDAEPGQSVWPVALDAEHEAELRRQIADLCDEEPDVDIDEEIPKHLHTFITLGIEEEGSTGA